MTSKSFWEWDGKAFAMSLPPLAGTLPSCQKLTRCPCRFIRFCLSFPPTRRSTSDRSEELSTITSRSITFPDRFLHWSVAVVCPLYSYGDPAPSFRTSSTTPPLLVGSRYCIAASPWLIYRLSSCLSVSLLSQPSDAHAKPCLGIPQIHSAYCQLAPSTIILPGWKWS